MVKETKTVSKAQREKVLLEIEKKTLVYSSEGLPFKQNNDNKPNLEISWQFQIWQFQISNIIQFQM